MLERGLEEEGEASLVGGAVLEDPRTLRLGKVGETHTHPRSNLGEITHRRTMSTDRMDLSQKFRACKTWTFESKHSKLLVLHIHLSVFILAPPPLSLSLSLPPSLPVRLIFLATPSVSTYVVTKI